jgi:hypothetical protein
LRGEFQAEQFSSGRSDQVKRIQSNPEAAALTPGPATAMEDWVAV